MSGRKLWAGKSAAVRRYQDGLHLNTVVSEDSQGCPAEWTISSHKYKRWAGDGLKAGSANGEPHTSGVTIKVYEMRLLAAAARWKRGDIQRNQLPMIPVVLAERIIRAGGLEVWVTSEKSRKKRFETMLVGQTPYRGLGLAPVGKI